MSTGKEEQDDFSLGHKMRHARKLRGVTQTEVAKLLNISKDYVSRIEKGERVPSHHIKAAIESWLLVDDEDLRLHSEEVPMEIEKALLAKVIRLVEEFYDEKNETREPAEKAELIVDLYDLFRGREEKLNKETLRNLAKLGGHGG